MSGTYIMKRWLWRRNFFFFFLLFFLVITTRPSLAGTDNTNNGGDIGDVKALSPTLSPPSSSVSQDSNNYSPLKPGVTIAVGILTAIFSITFVLLLYARHCKRPSGDANANLNNTSVARKNSGIDRFIINSLPAFRFGSLRGRKDGLECAVCLNRFEPADVLRLLPKCKHAFHVECVDTWLDAHSTCPLCRYRVHLEDVLLVTDEPLEIDIESGNRPPELPHSQAEPDTGGGVRRVSGRHSSAGEKASEFDLEILFHRPGGDGRSPGEAAPSTRRSLDGFNFLRRNAKSNNHNNDHESKAAVGCFDRPRRKDGMLLTRERSAAESASESEQQQQLQPQRRFEHRVIISRTGSRRERWSDPQPSDLLYLRSEMIIGDGGRRSSASTSGSRPPSFSSSRHARGRQQPQQLPSLPLRLIRREGGVGGGPGALDGRSVINERCVSEITGLRRSSNSIYESRRVASRWRAWISQALPSVRWDRTTVAA